MFGDDLTQLAATAEELAAAGAAVAGEAAAVDVLIRAAIGTAAGLVVVPDEVPGAPTQVCGLLRFGVRAPTVSRRHRVRLAWRRVPLRCEAGSRPGFRRGGRAGGRPGDRVADGEFAQPGELVIAAGSAGRRLAPRRVHQTVRPPARQERVDGAHTRDEDPVRAEVRYQIAGSGRDTQAKDRHWWFCTDCSVPRSLADVGRG